MGFRGVNVVPVPFTPRFDVLLWDYWTFGSVYCLILKKVDSQQRVNNVSFTHRETAEVL